MEKRQDFPDAALTQEKARQQIRARHKAWRMALPQEEVQEKSRKICERLAASDWYHNSAVIYGYYPLGAEADCLPFLAQALSDGKTVALPVTSKERLQRDCGREKRMQDTHRMEFYRIRELSRVREGAFHVMEPDESCKRIGEEDAVVLVPGLQFILDLLRKTFKVLVQIKFFIVCARTAQYHFFHSDIPFQTVSTDTVCTVSLTHIRRHRAQRLLLQIQVFCSPRYPRSARPAA